MASTYVENGLIYSTLANSDLAPLVELFVDELPARVDCLLDALQSSDMERLGRAAHQLKGAGGSYGFAEISVTAAKLETAVRGGGREAEIRAANNQLVEVCRRVRSGTPFHTEIIDA